MSDEINDRGERLYPGGYTYPEEYAPYVQAWELETSDINPVRFYEPKKPDQKKRIARWLNFIDR